MYSILILGLTVGVALGDVSLGYYYDKPTTSYGLPIYQVDGGNSAFSSASTFPSGNNAFSVVSNYPLTGGNVFSSNNYEYGGISSSGSSGPSSASSVTSGLNYNLLGSAGSSGSNSHYNTGNSGHYNAGSSGSNYHLINSGTSGSGLNSNYNFGATSTGLGQNSNYNTANAVSSGSNSNYNADSTSSGFGSNYNTASTGSGNYNAGGSNYNAAGSNNYNNAGSSIYNGGSLSSSHFSDGSGAGLNTDSNYNYWQGGQSSGVSYIPNYQTVPSVSVDTSALDKIGSYYQAASSANQFISNHQSSHVHKQEHVNVVQSNQPAQVFKHYYVHAAPEEPEEHKPRAPIVLPPPQKHYKIIFIKAPTQPQPQPQIIAVPQQTEEKTIVYVLVKKPEDAKNIVLPKFDQKTPTKPEVFFIKYNNKHDSQSLINNIVNDYNKGGISATFSGAGTSSLTSKLGEEDSSANKGSSSSSAASGVSQSDLDSTIQSVFGNSNSAQSDSSVSVSDVSSTGAVTSLDSLADVSASSVSSESSVSSDSAVSSNASDSSESSESSDNNSPLELSLNFASQTSSSDSIINDAEVNLASSADETSELKPSDNRAGDNAGENNGVLSFFNNFQNIGQTFQKVPETIQTGIPSGFQTIPPYNIIQNGFSSGQNGITSGLQSIIPENIQNVNFGNINLSTLRPTAVGSTFGSLIPGSSQYLGTGNIQSDTLLSGSNKFGSDYSSGSESSSSSTLGSSGSSGFSGSSGLSGSSEFGKYQFNTISTSQGVPHIAYGVPKFRS